MNTSSSRIHKLFRWLQTCILLILLVNGCYISHRYRAHPDRIRYGPHSQFDIEVFDYSGMIERVRAYDPIAQCAPDSADWFLACELLRRQEYLALDTGKFYYEIWIRHYCDFDANIKSTRMSVDSVFVWYGSDSLLRPVSIFVDTATKFNDLNGPDGSASVRPVGVPKKYKNDFHVAFRITLYDRSSDSLVDRIPISLRCKRAASLSEERGATGLIEW